MTGRFFLLDTERCVGCGACVLACRLENGWGDGEAWRRVLSLNRHRHHRGPTYFLSVACHHCDDPACRKACPSLAFEKRPDGIVIHREDLCIGCRYCQMACPFGALTYNSEKGVVGKCHLCYHRLDEGEHPACVAACPTDALLLEEDESCQAESSLPGFADPGGIGPRIRFRRPRLGPRAARLEDLQRLLTKDDQEKKR